MKSFLALLISSALVAAYASPTCDPEEARKCGMTMDDSNPYPKNPEELQQQCSDLEPKFKCLADFNSRCPGVNPVGSKEYVEAAIKLFTRVCHGDLTEKYLRNAECLSKVLLKKQQYCHEEYSDLIQEGDICKYKIFFVKCVAAYVDVDCGYEGLDLYREISKVTKFLYVENSRICP